MKEKIFGLVLAIVVVMLPVSVKADTFRGSVFGSADSAMTSTTLNDNSITCPKNSTGDTATCFIGINVLSGSATNFSVNAILTNMQFDEYKELGDWTMTSPVVNGNNITFNFSSRTGVSAVNKVLVAEITYKVIDKTKPCGIRMSTASTGETPTTPTNPICKVQGNKYYCKNANECTKAQYEAECLPNNPQTGSFVPYIVVLGGLGIAGALYFVTRKKAKIYHI